MIGLVIGLGLGPGWVVMGQGLGEGLEVGLGKDETKYNGQTRQGQGRG